MDSGAGFDDGLGAVGFCGCTDADGGFCVVVRLRIGVVSPVVGFGVPDPATGRVVGLLTGGFCGWEIGPGGLTPGRCPIGAGLRPGAGVPGD